MALAVKLFDEEHVLLGKAAKPSGMLRPEIMEHLARLNIPFAHY